MGGFYIGPALEDFHFDTVRQKLESGIHINSIYASIRRATVAEITKQSEERKNNPYVDTLYGGRPVTQKEYSRLSDAIARANRNIQWYIRENPDMAGIAPQQLVTSDILGKVTTRKGLRDITKRIEESYKRSNFVPVALNEDGEAGIKAELDYYKYFIETENERRAKARANAWARVEATGLLKTQQEFGMSPLDTSHWNTMEKIRKRSQYFTEAKDFTRAENWLREYEVRLESLAEWMYTNGGPEGRESIQASQAAIYRVLNEIITDENNVDLIRYLTQFDPRIAIQETYYADASDILNYYENAAELFMQFYKEYMK